MTIKPSVQSISDTLTRSSVKKSTRRYDSTVDRNAPASKKCDSYDPHDYGNENHPTIFWGPALHFFKAIVGTGILALPATFESVGYAIAIPSTILIGVLYMHIIHVLLDVEYELCKILKIPNLTYVGVVQQCFEQGPKPLQRFTLTAKFLVYFHYVVNGSLGNAVYLITIAGNFKMIIDYTYNVNSDIKVIISIVIVPLIILGLIKNLKFLVPMSTISNAFNFINIFLILYISSNHAGTSNDDVRAVNDVLKFPTFFGIVLGALTGTGMVLPLKNDMKNPREFSTVFGVLHLALVTSTILYVIFGFLGYVKYGSLIQPNILNNLPPENNLTFMVLLLCSVAICVSYTLFVYVAFDTVWSNAYDSTFSRMQNRMYMERGIRLGLTILPYFIAMAIPNFQILVSIGGVIGILIEVAVPPFIQILILTARSEQKTRMTYVIIFKDMFIVALALFLFVGGVINVIDTITAFFSQ
ncbi:proton-coupled amino acid transporter-like protein CG1139 [Planococcus citri]|uniref:proton-coupled amino acid transporter-like protein CG1139 n=1 Tax=Planococcus citri TaxID=170843 RepID=UPI0031F8211A